MEKKIHVILLIFVCNFSKQKNKKSEDEDFILFLFFIFCKTSEELKMKIDDKRGEKNNSSDANVQNPIQILTEIINL